MQHKEITPSHNAVYSLAEEAEKLANAHELSGDIELIAANERLGRAERVLDAIDSFSDNPSGEIIEMIAQARQSGAVGAIGDADRVAELAIVSERDQEKTLAHELNNQLDTGQLAVVDAIKDLNVVKPDQAKDLLEVLDAEAVYFHGSSYPFKVGDTITPGMQGVVDKEGVSHASATFNENEAWFYASEKERLTGVRGRVYEVVTSDGEPARRLGPQFSEVNSPSFKVVGVRDAMPGHQGTIPDVNWTEYSESSLVNHPEDPLPPHMPHESLNLVYDDDTIPLLGMEERNDFLESKWKSPF